VRSSAPVPLFRIDPGWLFLLAGAALLAAAILIPAHRELLSLRGELVRQETREQVVFERLRAYDEFLAGVREADPAIVRRLAMAHLNSIPAGEESLLLTPGVNRTVGEWVDASVPPRTVTVPPYPDTVLSRWALGPGRLWLLAGSATLVFMGLMFGPNPSATTTIASGSDGDPDALASAIAARGASAADPPATIADEVVELEDEDDRTLDGDRRDTPQDPACAVEIREPADEADGEAAYETADETADEAEAEIEAEAEAEAEAEIEAEAETEAEAEAEAEAWGEPLPAVTTLELSAAETEAWAASAPAGSDPGIGAGDWSMPSGESDTAATCDDIALALLDRADPARDAPSAAAEGAD